MEYLYVIKNNITNKYYIGTTNNVNKRQKRHINELIKNKHHSVYLQRSFNKYGLNAFQFYVLFESIDRNLINNMEEFLINKFYENTYNVSKKSHGGDLTSYHPNLKEIRQKKSENSKKMFEGEEGEKRKKNLKEKMSGENNYMFGKTHTEKARKLISEANKGKVISDEQRERISEAQKERYKKSEEKERASKRVIERYKKEEERLKTALSSKKNWESEEFRKKQEKSKRDRFEKNCDLIYWYGDTFYGIVSLVKHTGKASVTLRKMLEISTSDYYYIKKSEKRVVGEKQREKMSASRKGKKHSEETKSKMNEKKQIEIIFIYPDGEEILFNSLKDAKIYAKNKHEISEGTLENIYKSEIGFQPKKHKHKHLKGLKIVKNGKCRTTIENTLKDGSE